MTRFSQAASAAFLLCATLALTNCAQYQQAAEAFANGAVHSIQKTDDDYAQGAMLAPTAITLGAFSRLPQDPRRCAVATLSGVSVTGCTLTAADVQAIVGAELADHFGPAPVKAGQ